MSKRFRIAFSFAGEKRHFVAKIAARLAKRFGEEKILYDKYHEAHFSRSDLAFYLPDLYEKEAELVVAVFCPDYEKKEWCGLEWNAIFGLLKRRKVEELMLARFNHAEGKGLRGLAGYTDLDHKTPEQAEALILERLALNARRPKNYYLDPMLTASDFSDWQIRPPKNVANGLPLNLCVITKDRQIVFEQRSPNLAVAAGKISLPVNENVHIQRDFRRNSRLHLGSWLARALNEELGWEHVKGQNTRPRQMLSHTFSRLPSISAESITV